MDEMSKAAPHFVRCIKPNHEKKPNLFAESMITDQLRYTGALVTACHGLSRLVMLCHGLSLYHAKHRRDALPPAHL